MYTHDYNADTLHEKITAYISALIACIKIELIVQIRQKRLFTYLYINILL